MCEFNNRSIYSEYAVNLKIGHYKHLFIKIIFQIIFWGKKVNTFLLFIFWWYDYRYVKNFYVDVYLRMWSGDDLLSFDFKHHAVIVEPIGIAN